MSDHKTVWRTDAAWPRNGRKFLAQFGLGPCVALWNDAGGELVATESRCEAYRDALGNVIEEWWLESEYYKDHELICWAPIPASVKRSSI